MGILWRTWDILKEGRQPVLVWHDVHQASPGKEDRQAYNEMMKTSKILGEGIPFPFSILYARGARKYFMRIYKEIAGEVASEMGAGHLLDLGTGHGLLPIEIAKTVPGAEITGIDVSRDMIRIARKNAKREGLSDRVKFQVDDANNLSFDDSSFDFYY